MTLTLWDVLAYALITLVITLVIDLTLVWGVIMYIQRLHKSIMAAISALQRTDSTIADEQHTQTALLAQMLSQLTEQTKVLIVGNGPRWAEAKRKEANQRRKQELTSFLINSGFFTGVDNQRRLLMSLTPPVISMIDADRYPHQNVASLLQSIVNAAEEYDQIPSLCRAVTLVLNGSQTGGEFRAKCIAWGVTPHEREPDATD